MTAQEILEGITRHRANPMSRDLDSFQDGERKINEIEWALQAIAEKLVELEARQVPPGFISHSV